MLTVMSPRRTFSVVYCVVEDFPLVLATIMAAVMSTMTVMENSHLTGFLDRTGRLSPRVFARSSVDGFINFS
jgi:hypothetical protein